MLSKLPTDDNLRTRGCTIVSVCVLCYKHAETSSHLFLECTFAASVWRWLGVKLNCSMSLLSYSSLLECIPHRCSSQVSDVFAAAIIHTVHTIWLARNTIRFSSSRINLHNILEKISTLVTMSGVHSTGNCVVGDVALLNSLLITPSYRRVRDIVPVIWQPPTSTWVKANTDGSVIGSNSSCGGIFRDHTGAFLGGFSSNLGLGTVFEAELTGLMLAIEYAASHNWYRLWLESDSSSAVLSFKNQSAIPIRLRNRWHNCMQLGLSIICTHIFREGNCCADALATMGHDLLGTTWFHILSSSLSVDFTRDRNGLPNFRFP
jgi:ribonuclease HI